MTKQFKTAAELGQFLKQARRTKQLTQKQLATGICAQSLISALEAGTYLPNAILLAQLCERLGLSLDATVLAHYPTVSVASDFNTTVETLCNQHAYSKLAAYLAQPAIEAQLQTDEDLAVFYYYQGVAAFQGRHQVAAAQQAFKLALTMAPVTLRFLVLSAQGFVAMQTGQLTSGRQAFKQAIIAMQDLSQYDENQQCVYYQAGLSEFYIENLPTAQTYLEQGIALATAHQSHYLLADLLVLSAACADQRHQPANAKKAREESELLQQLFHLQTYQFNDES